MVLVIELEERDQEELEGFLGFQRKGFEMREGVGEMQVDLGKQERNRV